MRLLLAIFLPFVVFFTIGRPGAGIICLILQITVLGWIPAALWAVYSLSQYTTDQKIASSEELNRPMLKPFLIALAVLVAPPSPAPPAAPPVAPAAPPAAPAAPPAAPPTALRDVSALLTPIREKHDLPGMVCAIVQGDKLVAIGAAGVRSRGKPEPMLVTDRVHIGSCTKAMTATLCGMLVEDGKLSWTMKVADAFPEFASKIDPGWKDATLEQLLMNHGGSPAGLDADGLWGKLWVHTGTPREQRMALVEGVLSHPPQAPPGTKFIYSNAGFAIAGIMAERAMNTPYEELLTQRLFIPLGMTSAGFGAPGTAGQNDQPRGHGANKQPVEVGPGSDNPAAITPAGRVHCSIGDWAKFIALHVRGERGTRGGPKPLATSDTFIKLHTPFPGDDSHYAMGWAVLQRPWGGRVLTHSGSNNMWYCVAWLAPDKDFAVLVATNQGGDAAAKACDEVASALIADQLQATAKVAADAAKKETK